MTRPDPVRGFFRSMFSGEDVENPIHSALKGVADAYVGPLASSSFGVVEAALSVGSARLERVLLTQAPGAMLQPDELRAFARLVEAVEQLEALRKKPATAETPP